MKFGYARISKQDNNYYLDLQKKKILLEGVTVDNMYIDVLDIKDGVYSNLETCLSLLKSDDELVVYSLDRFGKVFSQLSQMLSEFNKKRIRLQVLNSAGIKLDTKDKNCLLYYYAKAFAESDEVVISNRIKIFNSIPRSMDDNLGRPTKVSVRALQEISHKMKNREVSVEALCEPYRLSPKDIYKYVYQNGELRPEGIAFLEKYSKY
jgi:DNA invertase Pin-like site-specific DNA recombinase